ncbi:PadR family transcriptional regulator [Cryobacterium sp. SO2]|uniref:PadR family transcriptional regulator n=1 Tax=Cryobacterium sp. SO2 TaxID=1897060 RepID=UPI00223D2535|nr:PadR family transcriptional regulator [Cryobacterium sp. SO2]WEO77330.1 PadR family transcriptional regulator [Cryobacterium sp. SO2]
MATDVGTQLRKGVVEYCVLGLLQGAPTYGWKISERLVSLGLIGSIGTLYPLLSRLRDQGLIIAQADESDSARPRKYYSLTPAGREQLGLFRAQWQPFSDAVSTIIATPTATPTATPNKEE